MTERGEYDDDLMFREVGESGDWASGSRVVTYQDKVAMASASCMTVEDAKHLVTILNKYDLRPYDLAQVEALRKKIAGLDIDIDLLRAELVDRRRHRDSLLEANNRYLQRARDAEALVKVLQARLSALPAPSLAPTEAA
jgi:hypothetical protein